MISKRSKETFYYFSPTVISTLCMFIYLPFLTSKLELKDFGYFYSCSMISFIFGVITAFGSSLSISKYFHNHTLEEKKIFLSTAIFFNMTISLFISILVFVFWENFTSLFLKNVIGATDFQKAVIVFSVFIYGSQLFTSEVLIIEKKAIKFFYFSSISSITSLFVIITMIIFSNQTIDILFYSLMTANFLSFIYSLILLRVYLCKFPNLATLRKILREFKIISANIMENISLFIERALIVNNLGLDKFALFTHSKNYEKFLTNSCTAVMRSIWSDELTNFKKKKKIILSFNAINLINLICLFGSTFFATIGFDLISLITNNKFSEATYFVSFLFLVGLYKNTNLPYTVVIHTLGKSSDLANQLYIEKISLILILFLSIKSFGIYGLLLAYIISTIVDKIYIIKTARKYINIEIIEKKIFITSILILVTIFFSLFFTDEFITRMYCFLIFSSLNFIYYFNDIKKLLYLIKQ